MQHFLSGSHHDISLHDTQPQKAGAARKPPLIKITGFEKMTRAVGPTALRFFGFQIVQSRCGRRFRLPATANRGEGIGEGNGLAADDAEGDGTCGTSIDAVAAAGAVVQGQLAQIGMTQEVYKRQTHQRNTLLR